MCNKPTTKNNVPFKSLYSLLDYFNGEDMCFAYLEHIRWNDKPYCPRCYADNITALKTEKNTYVCNGCRKRFNAKTGTIFEDTRIPLRKWFLAIYLENASIGGVTAGELERHLEISRNTANMVLRKIRATGYEQGIFKEDINPKETTAVYELDTMVRDGENRSRHKHLKKKYAGGNNRTRILLIARRGGHARGYVIANEQWETMKPYIQGHIPVGATIYTDSAPAFNTLRDLGYRHDIVIHSDGEYVKADVYTNTVEGWHSFFQTGLMKFRNNISKEYTQDYVNAAVFRYNTRNESEVYKFNLVLKNIFGRCLVGEQVLTQAA